MDLVDVDEAVLDELVAAAVGDAAPDEVTPQLTPGTEWTDERIAWLRELHRSRRTGLSGPAGEATWAIVTDGRVVGQVRLKRTDDPGVLETGIWLVRAVRDRGLGAQAIAAALQKAAEAGAQAVRADTTSANHPALGVLRRLGFRLQAGDGPGAVRAVVRLDGVPGG